MRLITRPPGGAGERADWCSEHPGRAANQSPEHREESTSREVRMLTLSKTKDPYKTFVLNVELLLTLSLMMANTQYLYILIILIIIQALAHSMVLRSCIFFKPKLGKSVIT